MLITKAEAARRLNITRQAIEKLENRIPRPAYFVDTENKTMIDSAQSARIKYALALRDLFFRDERAYWQGRPAYQLGQLGQCITLRSQHAAAKRLIVMLPRPSDSHDRGF